MQLGVEVRHIELITRLQFPTELPNAPSHLFGISRFQERIVRVLNLHSILSLPGELWIPREEETRMMLFLTGNRWAGIPVFDLEEVREVPDAFLVADRIIYPGQDLQYFIASGKLDDQDLGLLDIYRILGLFS